MQPGWDRLQRIIGGLVALIALGSLSAGAGFFSLLTREELRASRLRGGNDRDEIVAHLNESLGEHSRATGTLAGDVCLQRALLSGDPGAIDDANNILDLYASHLGAEACYLIDRRGVVVATSNRAAPDSFLGKSYAFRPYFTEALAGRPAVYPARGVTSNRRGIYFSHPVRAAAGEAPAGVLAIKSGVEQLERWLSAVSNDGVVIDADGMVLLSNRAEWRLRPLWGGTPEQRRRWTESRQFGPGPWEPVGYRRRGDRAVSPAGVEYRLSVADIPGLPDWQLALLVDEAALARAAWGRALLPGSLIVGLCLALVAAGWFFVRWGRREVALRVGVERSREELIAQLRQSLGQVKRLEGLLPICSRCKKIRDEAGGWHQIETYVHDRTDAHFTHGICPDCQAVLFPGVHPRTPGDPHGGG